MMAEEGSLLQHPFFQKGLQLRSAGKNPIYDTMEAGGADSKVPAPNLDAAAPLPNEVPRPRPAAPEAPYRPATGTVSDEDLAKKSWPEYLSGAAQNLPGSATRQVSNLADAIYNYDQTIPALAGLGKGALSKAAGSLGFEQDREQKARDEAGVNALMADYNQAYKGLLSGDVSGVRRTFYEDPARVGMDVASVAPVIGPAGRAVGMGKTASAAARIGSLADPLQLGLEVAGQAVKIPGYAAKGALARTSGVDSSILDVIQNAGRTGTREQLQAMSRHASGSANPLEQIDTAVAAANEWKKNVENSFVADMGSLATTPLDVTPALNAIKDARAHIGTYVKTSIDPATGATIREVKPISPNDAKVLDDMEEMLLGSSDRSAINLHKVKVGMSNLMDNLGRSKYLGSIGKVPAALRDTIGAANPRYLKAMDDYTNWLRQLEDLRGAGATGNRGSTANKIAKLMKAMKDKNGRSLINQLASTNAGANLPYMLAGSAMSNWLPKWATGMQDMLGYSLLGGAGSLAGMFTPHALVGLAAASPKVVGTGMKYVGKAQRLGDIAGTVANPAVRNIISRVNELGLTEPVPLEGTQQAAGGRIGRKAGGRIGAPGMAAEKLIVAAERAKKKQGGATSALLNVPDEAITKALAVANEHI